MLVVVICLFLVSPFSGVIGDENTDIVTIIKWMRTDINELKGAVTALTQTVGEHPFDVTRFIFISNVFFGLGLDVA